MGLYTRDRYKLLLNVNQFPHYPRILIEGDSWTDHPFVANIAWVLHLYLGRRVHILNISCIGDLIANIGNKDERQFKLLEDVLGRRAYDFDLLFLSGGGNDLLANSDVNLKLNKVLKEGTGDDPENYMDLPKLEQILTSIKDAYTAILDMASDVNSDMPALAHNYDFIYPRNAGVDIIIDNIKGPWIYPEMCKKHITDQTIQKSITDYMLHAFNPVLNELKQAHSNFDFVDTQNTLPKHSGPWTDDIRYWDDEIHPNSKGFNMLVEKRIGPAIEAILDN